MTLKTLLIALALLPRFGEDREAVGKLVQEEAIGRAVLHASHGDPELASFLLAWEDAETHGSLRIHRGECYRWECDRGRARGPWQLHRNAMSASKWSLMIGVENTQVQADEAAHMARWALKDCHATGDMRIVTAFRRLGAKGCNEPLPGEQDRLAAFKRVRAKL